MKASRCKSCGADIVWVIGARTGKRMPLDLGAVDDGSIILDDRGRAVVLGKGDVVISSVPRYRSHFATCGQADEWRGRR